ncbi:hypothetical protein [Sinomicrobium soli]|uniref:hypothetical protein n=1 Tax=Sinomicrobium sp. N-1-3-6 TaxID=2219864 RepID=UPI000DCCF2A4|nr:hypothetical protein [Sinomicrobium sp. N-1-3-6]RAV29097.1 hypothetical protein DN748_09230 [Sinomicrobium sp. N-1-3-6]
MEHIAPVTFTEYLVLFILCLGCYLIGYLFAKKHSAKKYGKILDQCLTEKQLLEDSLLNQPGNTPGNIRAVKTRERRGALYTGDNPLDFERLGHAGEDHRDNLKKINGIGPFIEEKLNAIGIFTYEQISRFNEQDIEQVTELLRFFPGRIKRDNWKGQAIALKKKM